MPNTGTRRRPAARLRASARENGRLQLYEVQKQVPLRKRVGRKLTFQWAGVVGDTKLLNKAELFGHVPVRPLQCPG